MDTTSILSEATLISVIHRDIIENLILTRLDCLTLASLSCTCSHFHALSSQETVWRDICLSTWPSINDQRVIQVIGTFPKGYFSFFSDCYPVIVGSYNQPKMVRMGPLPSELISAVDVWYHNKPIFSRVIQTETKSAWFRHSPFRVDLLHPKEAFPTSIEIIDWDEDMWHQDLLQNLTLSWIIIDSTHKRATNFSSLKPVSVQRHWLTGEIRVEYAAVLACYQVGFVECKVVLICGCRKERGELQAREDSLVALVTAMKFGKRVRGASGLGRKMHQDFMEMVRRRNENKVLIERMLDMACVVVISIFLTFSTLYLFGRWS